MQNKPYCGVLKQPTNSLFSTNSCLNFLAFLFSTIFRQQIMSYSLKLVIQQQSRQLRTYVNNFSRWYYTMVSFCKGVSLLDFSIDQQIKKNNFLFFLECVIYFSKLSQPVYYITDLKNNKNCISFGLFCHAPDANRTHTFYQSSPFTHEDKI